MPKSSIVEIDLQCPQCGRATRPPEGIVTFQWGHVPTPYRGTEAIRWMEEPPGHLVPPFHYILKRGGQTHYNFGDPAIAHLIAFDSEPIDEYVCSYCDTPFEAIAVEIRDGRIAAGLAFRPGECAIRFNRTPDQLAVVEIEPDGTARPHDEWLDVPLIPFANKT